MIETNEILVTRNVVSADEQAQLAAWADTELAEGRLVANPRNPFVYVTPFRSADGRLTSLTLDPQRSMDKLVWVPEVASALLSELPPAFWSVRKRVIERVGICRLDEDCYKGSFLSLIQPGGAIGSHRDSRISLAEIEYLILRCNVMFQRPESGGLPIIEDEVVEVPDRGMWVFYPTELVHAATPVEGSRWRGTLSFGFMVPRCS